MVGTRRQLGLQVPDPGGDVLHLGLDARQLDDTLAPVLLEPRREAVALDDVGAPAGERVKLLDERGLLGCDRDAAAGGGALGRGLAAGGVHLCLGSLMMR